MNAEALEPESPEGDFQKRPERSLAIDSGGWTKVHHEDGSLVGDGLGAAGHCGLRNARIASSASARR